MFTLTGGLLMLLDTAWGITAALGLDWTRAREIVLGVSLMLGLPAYLLDLLTAKRMPLFLLGLFFFRWLARCYGGPTFVLCNPLRGSILLIVAFALLQWSWLRKPSA
jgi:hypothetical protein